MRSSKATDHLVRINNRTEQNKPARDTRPGSGCCPDRHHNKHEAAAALSRRNHTALQTLQLTDALHKKNWQSGIQSHSQPLPLHPHIHEITRQKRYT